MDVQLFQHYLLEKLSSFNCFCTLTKNQLGLLVLLFLILCPVPLIYAFPPIPYNINYYSYVVKSWNQANWLFLLNYYFFEFKSIWFPYKFKTNLVYIYNKCYWDHDRNCIKPVYQFGENWHHYYAESSSPWTQYVWLSI